MESAGFAMTVPELRSLVKRRAYGLRGCYSGVL